MRGTTVASAEPPKRRVVVTGMGCVTSLGHEKTTFYKCACRCVAQCSVRTEADARDAARAFCSNLLAGKSGISQIERWDPKKYELTTTIAGEIKGAALRGFAALFPLCSHALLTRWTDFDPTGWMTVKMSRRVDPFIAYLVVAAKKALHDAGFAEGSDEMCGLWHRPLCAATCKASC